MTNTFYDYLQSSTDPTKFRLKENQTTPHFTSLKKTGLIAFSLTFQNKGVLY